LCAKLPKDFEKRILRDNRKENKRRVYVVSPVKRVTCDLYADPHARSFDGKYFEAQTEGEWCLHKGQTLIVDFRGKKFGSWVGVVDWIVNVKGDIVRNTGFSGVTVNGAAAQLPSGKKFELPNGGSILHAGNKVTISSESGEEVDFISFGSFFNAYVRSNLAHVSGLCSHQFVKSHAFGTTHTQRILHPKLRCPRKAKHMRYCRGKGLKGVAQLNCAFDLCAKLPVAFEKRILRRNRKENRKRLKKRFVRGPFAGKRRRRHFAPLIMKRLIRRRNHRKFGGFGGQVRRTVHRGFGGFVHRAVRRHVVHRATRRHAPVWQAPRRVHRAAQQVHHRVHRAAQQVFRAAAPRGGGRRR
jgi:hypothetical protein